MIRQILTVGLSALVFLGLGAALTIAEKESPGPSEGAESTGGDFERGPHRGRLLRAGKLSVEITIFEEGVPPEFHVYPYLDDKPLSPDAINLTIELARLGGRVDKIPFKPQGDYLLGLGTIVEPHSFDVRVQAEYQGQTSEWAFESHEGRTQIPDEVAKASGVEIEVAGPAVILDVIELKGTVDLNADRVARVGARFPGVVKSVAKSIGQRVKAGDELAVIESNESLRGYPLQAPMDGIVLSRSASVGHTVSPDKTLFEIADLSDVWIDLYAFGSDADKIRPGQAVMIENMDGSVQADGLIDLVRPHTEGTSQAVAVRAVLDNSDGRWRPGSFVRGRVTVSEKQVPLAVKSSGLQRFRDFTVVFAKVDDTYEVRMLELGATDGNMTEVLGGIEPGQAYVSDNSFLIKADVEKSGASHDH